MIIICTSVKFITNYEPKCDVHFIVNIKNHFSDNMKIHWP